MASSGDIASRPGHVIRVDGVSIHYEVHGRGEPLLLLHAGSLTAEMWQPYLAVFAEHYRVIAPDMRGHGRSDNPTGAMTYRQLADETVAFVRALDLHRPLIAGFSDGGQVALEIGMRHPDLPRAIVMGGVWFKFSEVYRAWVRDAVGDETSPEVDTTRLARHHPEWAARLEQLQPPPGALVVAYCHHGIRSLSAAALLEQAGIQPVVSLHGGIDAWSLRIDPQVPRY